eukprot:9500511-Pyramimonas_sp.AAC.1
MLLRFPRFRLSGPPWGPGGVNPGPLAVIHEKWGAAHIAVRSESLNSHGAPFKLRRGLHPAGGRGVR